MAEEKQKIKSEHKHSGAGAFCLLSHLSSSLGFSVAFCLSLSSLISHCLRCSREEAAYSATPPFLPSPSTSGKKPRQPLSTPLFSASFISTHPLMSLHPLFSLSTSSPVGAYLLFGGINSIFTADYFVWLCVTCYWRERSAPMHDYLSVTRSSEPGFITISDRLWVENQNQLSTADNLVN